MSQEQTKSTKRDFLKVLGLGSVAAVAPVAVAAVQASETKDEKLKSRYKETDHVKAFYKTNRY